MQSYTMPAEMKLLDISEVMSDGYYFVKARMLIEDWAARADQGDPDAVEFMKILDTFHRFCLACKK